MRVAILGAGVTGLSAAYHLKKDWVLIEKERKVGGLAASDTINGFTFDKTGHLLHMHNPYTKEWLINNLLKDKLASHNRDSWIYSKDVFTRFPFQANTYGLPKKVIAECVIRFLKERDKKAQPHNDPSFKRWCEEVFGSGISKHFMIPYNQKLWQYPLGKMTTEWIRNFIPVPSREEVLYGALVDQKKFFGYNASFYYPKTGGIQVLPDAIASQLEGEIIMGSEALKIDTHSKVIHTTTGSYSYDWLINTSPLHTFLGKLEPGLPKPLEATQAKALEYTIVYNLNLGIKRANVTDKHWVYFPEKQYPFYRVGVASNFSKTIAPEGTTSFYVEFAKRPGVPFDFKFAELATLKAMKEFGFMRPKDEIAVCHWNVIEPGYVIYTHKRRDFMPQVFSYLQSKQILSVGRYGAWKYSFMEECILDGKAAAEKVISHQ